MILNTLCNISIIGLGALSGGHFWMVFKDLYLMRQYDRRPNFNSFYQLINIGFFIGLGSTSAYIILQKPIFVYLMYG